MRKKVEKIKEEEIISSEESVCVKKKCCGGLWGKLGLLILVAALIGGGYYLWTVYGQSGPVSQEQQKREAEKQIKALMVKVGRHIVLPAGELPEVVMVENAVEAIKSQPSLSGVVNGNIILIYTGTSRAIVYSPSRDLIINVLPIQTTPPAQAASATTSTPKKK